MLSIDSSPPPTEETPPACSPFSRKNFLRVLPDVLIYSIIFEYLLPNSDDPSSVLFLASFDSIVLNRQDRNTLLRIMAMDACRKGQAVGAICRGLNNSNSNTDSYLRWLLLRRLAVKHIEFSLSSSATTEKTTLSISEFLKTYAGSHLIENVEVYLMKLIDLDTEIILVFHFLGG
jgi:hypothetical protein